MREIDKRFSIMVDAEEGNVPSILAQTIDDRTRSRIEYRNEPDPGALCEGSPHFKPQAAQLTRGRILEN